MPPVDGKPDVMFVRYSTAHCYSLRFIQLTFVALSFFLCIASRARVSLLLMDIVIRLCLLLSGQK